MTKIGQRQRCMSALALVAMFVTAVNGTPAARAQTYTVLHTFKGPGGEYPYAGLIVDSAGNLYGTTAGGGASGQGVVFKLDKTGETVLYSFTGGADGAGPYAGVIRDSAGNLYGTTAGGGASGYGVVFKLDTTGTETVLHSFTGADGLIPYAGVIRDSAGNLYGTTYEGGASGAGVVFKLDTTGTETVLHSFTGGADGANPHAGVIRDSAGNLYGTATGGGLVSGSCHDPEGPGMGCGVVFKVDTTGTETVLHSFTGGADCWGPFGGLIRDLAGNLYGTTAGYCGGVFKLGTTGKLTVLYSFLGGADGWSPAGRLLRDSAGNLYGTTTFGGLDATQCDFVPFFSGCGVVFKLDTTGTETVLYSFTGGADGAAPEAGLIQDSAGDLYGTASEGGISGGPCRSGCGVVFMLKP